MHPGWQNALLPPVDLAGAPPVHDAGVGGEHVLHEPLTMVHHEAACCRLRVSASDGVDIYAQGLDEN